MGSPIAFALSDREPVIYSDCARKKLKAFIRPTMLRDRVRSAFQANPKHNGLHQLQLKPFDKMKGAVAAQRPEIVVLRTLNIS